MPIGSSTYGSTLYGGESALEEEEPPAPGPDAFITPVTQATMLIELAVTSPPLTASPTWVDISAYFRRGTVRRGRSSDLDRVSAGTFNGTFTNLEDGSRPFDPLNGSSPWYPNLLPNRPIRVSAVVAGVTKPIFYGFVEDYEQTYEKGVGGDADSVCVITASDALSLFAQMDYVASRPVEPAGTRVNAILDSIGWPAGLRVVDAGMTVMAAFDNTGPEDSAISVLDALHMVDVTEQGRFYVSATNEVVFRDRNTLVTVAAYTTNQVVFGDDLSTGEIPYTDIAFDHSRNVIRNAVTVTNPLWGDFLETDGASIAAYGRRAYSLTAHDATGVASRSTARNLLRLHKDAQSRVSALKVKTGRGTPGRPTGFVADAVSLGLGWRVGVARRGADYTISQSYSIESLAYLLAPKQISAELTFGLPQVAAEYWIWGTSLWGSTTKWAW